MCIAKAFSDDLKWLILVNNQESTNVLDLFFYVMVKVVNYDQFRFINDWQGRNIMSTEGWYKWLVPSSTTIMYL